MKDFFRLVGIGLWEVVKVLSPLVILFVGILAYFWGINWVIDNVPSWVLFTLMGAGLAGVLLLMFYCIGYNLEQRKSGK